MDIKKKETVKELRNLLYQYTRKNYKKSKVSDIYYSVVVITNKIMDAESDYPYSEDEYSQMIKDVRGLI